MEERLKTKTNGRINWLCNDYVNLVYIGNPIKKGVKKLRLVYYDVRR
jgi:hypothetical protein